MVLDRGSLKRESKMLLKTDDKDEWDRGVKAVEEIFDVCVELGGTVTGEHGVGISKALSFQKERASELSSILAIKQAMDPENILNPGKAVPELHRCAEWGRMHVHAGQLKHPELPRF